MKNINLYIMLLVCIFIILLLVSVLYLQHYYKSESIIYNAQLNKQLKNQEELNKNETKTAVNPYYNDYNDYNDYYWFNPYKYWYNRNDYYDRHHNNHPYYKHKTVIINKQPNQAPAHTQAPAPPIITVSLTSPEPQEISPLPKLSAPENIMPENIIMPTLSS